MRIYFHKRFRERHKKLRVNEQRKCEERLSLFLHDQFHPLLHNHPLTGKYKGYRSINITGDLRALYQPLEDGALFITLGTHPELYS